MIETIHSAVENKVFYSSDNGRCAIVRHYFDRIEAECHAHDEKYNITFHSQEEATTYLRDFLHAMPMQDFLQQYKGIINQKGLAKIAGRSVNYMSHVATGRRTSSEDLKKAVEQALRDLGKALTEINII